MANEKKVQTEPVKPVVTVEPVEPVVLEEDKLDGVLGGALNAYIKLDGIKSGSTAP
jgi:hypothetical protein